MSDKSQLVRARVKAVEYLPEYVKCCDDCIAYLYELGEIVVDLSRRESCQDGEHFCNWCDAPRPAAQAVLNTKTGKYLQFEVLDLDEGPTP